MQSTAIKTPLISQGDHLLSVLSKNLPRPLEEKDVVCVASKVVAIEQGRVVRLSDVQPSDQAQGLIPLANIRDPEKALQFAELVLRESDAIFDMEGGIVYPTLKDNILIANAGVDLSNAPPGCAILLPENPWAWARAFREQLKTLYGLEDLGVVVTDSCLTPLRRGVTGLAIAFSGFEGVQSEIGHPDLFGRLMEMTEKATADDLASAAVLVTGESSQRTPFVRIQDAPLVFTDREIDPAEGFISPRVDLYAGIYSQRFRYILESDGHEG